jgi:hypothetical protein
MHSQLFEQIITRANKRLWYHGSPFKFDSFKLSNIYNHGAGSDGLFLSKSWRFSIGYALYANEQLPREMKKQANHEPTLYTVMLTEPKLNLCNFRNDRERDEILDKIDDKKTLNFLWDVSYSDGTWNSWRIMEDDDVMEHLRELDYDGVWVDEGEGVNIMLFRNVCRIIDTEKIIIDRHGFCTGTDKRKLDKDDFIEPSYGK